MLTQLATADLTKNEIFLPKSFLEEFKNGGSRKLAMIYSKQSKTVHLFSLEEEIEWILKIQIEFFPPIRSSNITKLLTTLKEYFGQIVYSTGICNYQEDCLWEGYATNHTLPDLNEVKRELGTVSELKNVELSLEYV